MDKQAIYIGDECGKQLIIANQHLFFFYANNSLFSDVSSYADDAAMDSIEKALKNVSSFEGTLPQFRSWVKLIVTNTCRDYGKRKRALLSDKGVPEMKNLDDEDISYFELRGVEQKELNKAVRSLKPKYREIIILTYKFGLSGREIAFKMNLNENSVPQFRKRALQDLSRILGY